MADEPFFESANATVTDTAVVIGDQSFPVADIAGVSMWDERPKAKRWTLIGAVLAAAGLIILLIATHNTPGGTLSPGAGAAGRLTSDTLRAVGFLMLVIGGGAWLVLNLNKRAGTGLVIEMTDGKSEMIDGITRHEVSRLHSAILLWRAESVKRPIEALPRRSSIQLSSARP